MHSLATKTKTVLRYINRRIQIDQIVDEIHFWGSEKRKLNRMHLFRDENFLKPRGNLRGVKPVLTCGIHNP